MENVIAGYQALGIGLTRVSEDPDSLEFHQRAQDVISAETKRVASAARGLDPDLTPQARNSRILAIFATSRARLEKALTDLVESVFGERLRAAKKNLSKAQALPTDPIERLAFEARVGEARRQIESLTGTARYQALQGLADKADPRFLPILRDSVVALVQDDVRQALESRYFAAAAGPEAAYMQATAECVEEATDLTKAAYVALGSVAARLGVSLSDFSSLKPKDVVSGLSPSVQAAAVARYGASVLDDIRAGKAPLSTIFDLI